MSEQMVVRGPDKGGLFLDEKVGLAHRRLSIIDLETGDQPMVVAGGEIVLVFNGEIYNFRELRERLIREGEVFHTQSDTEVIGLLYRSLGIEECLQQLEGMFAFALYDKRKDEIYVARDRWGEKPLYYQLTEEKFAFASELKAFSPDLSAYEMDKKALNYFLSLSYIPAPYTIYKEIRKMMPGTYIRISADRELSVHRYYDLFSVFHPATCSMDTAKETIRARLFDSVKKRMIADVPMGAFLSGGIDSSVICGIMSQLSDRPVNTFSIGFKEKEYDESKRARLVAQAIGANHTEYRLDYADVLVVLEDLLLYYDEPFADSSAIPSYYVAKLARQHVKVVLTGDCADELFGGYEKYLGAYYVDKYRRLPAGGRKLFERVLDKIPGNRYTNNFLRKAGKVVRNAALSGFDLYYHLLCLGFSDSDRRRLLCGDWYEEIRPEIAGRYAALDKGSDLQKQQFCDVSLVLEGGMFPKVDRACMHNSLESRSPFMDMALVELALNLPDAYKIRGRNKKYILKQAFKEMLPAKTRSFSKRGFGVPVDYWLRNELKEELSSLLDENFLRRQGLFDPLFTNELLKAHLAARANYKNQLWNLFVFQKWYSRKIKE